MSRWSLAALPSSRWQVLRDGDVCDHATWLCALAGDGEARSSLIAVLREAPFAAYFWETPPVRDGQLAELVLVDSPALARSQPDPSAFREKFSHAPVATFANLGKDSVLVAPHPAHAPGSTHLAAFVRQAPDEVVHALFRAVGLAVADWLRSRGKPLWVSTSGLAVPWLHVRLDATPKYYSYVPYRRG